jgi:hypothetical protein
MKNTKKGVKRNPVLVLAVLGLLVGAGATGAIAAGLIPNLDTGVTGSVTADVQNSPLLTLSGLDTGATAYSTGAAGTIAKFSETVTVLAPGSATVGMTVKVNRMGDATDNAILVKMTGLSDYVTVGLATSAVNNSVSISRIANGEWIVSGATAPFEGNLFALTFTIYVSQYDSGTAGAVDNVWDFAISEVDANSAVV